MAKPDTRKDRSSWAWICVMVVVVGAAAWIINAQLHSTFVAQPKHYQAATATASATPTARIVSPNKISDASLSNVASTIEYLREHTRNPASLSFIEVKLMTKSGSVCITYRGQNGFGGMEIEQAIYDVRRNVMIPADFSSFREEYNTICSTHYASRDVTQAAKETLAAVQQQFK